MKQDKWIARAAELQSLAQAGLWYGHDKYDRERYARMREIAAEMLADRADLPVEDITPLFCGDKGYQTPKLDTRAAVFIDGRILLVQESDGRWSLPGGWVDYDLSPAENCVKEVREEAGLIVRPVLLIAVHDHDRHNTPKYVYKIITHYFLCEKLGGAFEANLETVASGTFGEDDLPPLSEARNSADQIRMCFEAYRERASWRTRFE